MTELRPQKNNTFCSFPWNGVQVHVSGQIRPCCMMDDIGVHYQKGQSLQSALNTPRLISIKEKMLSHQESHECRTCKEEDQLGITSVRRMSTALKNPIASEIRPLHRSEISFTNSCNLDCVMCRPEFSSKVFSLYKEYYEENSLSQERLDKIKPFSIDESDVDSLVEQLKDSHEMRLIGGEPLMTKAGRLFIKLWADRGYTGELFISTNGTFLDEQLIDDLSRCKNVLVNISVDGFGAHYDWIRGYSWDKLSQKILAAHQKLRLKITPTLQVYNLLNIPELAEFCYKHKIPIRLGHVLRHPHHLSALLWPHSVRAKCAENYKELWGEDHLDAIQFLRQDNQDHVKLFPHFEKWTHFMNNKRGQSWSTIEPRSRWLMTP